MLSSGHTTRDLSTSLQQAGLRGVFASQGRELTEACYPGHVLDEVLLRLDPASRLPPKPFIESVTLHHSHFQIPLRVGKPYLFAVTVERPGGVVKSDKSSVPIIAGPPSDA